jgi:hypothetical protein
MKTRRLFLKVLAVIAASPTLIFAQRPKELRAIYRLDGDGCNLTRVRMKDLREGDLFLYDKEANHYVSPVMRACSNPTFLGDTWSITTEGAELS